MRPLWRPSCARSSSRRRTSTPRTTTRRARRSPGRPSAPPGTARPRPCSTATPPRLGDVARDTVARLRPVARSLGDDDVLDGVAAVLECGGAERQREAFATGGRAGVLRRLVRETGASATRFQTGPEDIDGSTVVVDCEEDGMPDKRPSVKNEKQYEALKEKGMSKERAAKIANSPGASSTGRQEVRLGRELEAGRHDRPEEGGRPQGRQGNRAQALVGSLRAPRDLVRLDLLRARQRPGPDVQRDRRAGPPLPPAAREGRRADRLREGLQGGGEARPGRRDRQGLRGSRRRVRLHRPTRTSRRPRARPTRRSTSRTSCRTRRSTRSTSSGRLPRPREGRREDVLAARPGDGGLRSRRDRDIRDARQAAARLPSHPRRTARRSRRCSSPTRSGPTERSRPAKRGSPSRSSRWRST